MRVRGMRVAFVAAAVMAMPASASGAVSGVLAGHTLSGQAMPCATQTDGIRLCVGSESGIGGNDLRFETFDGAPLQMWVTLPPRPASGGDGGYPLVVQNHGWGAPPSGPDDYQFGGPTARMWAKDGYAVVEYAARGWGQSCGTPESRLVNPPACVNGYIRLDDYRYEARDVQDVVGLLVDEGIADPNRVGVHGESYGGGTSLQLATLNDRVMNPDGTLSAWKSPKGTPLHIAASAPFATWSDMVYSLAPNGRTFDSKITPLTADLAPVGVMKATIVSGLYTVGTESGFYPPAGFNAEADMTQWYARTVKGEPYTTAGDVAMVDLIARYHSPYYLLAGAYGMGRRAPSPLLMTNGFTDDVFPIDEVLRYYNLNRKLNPQAPMSLFFFDGGHQRGQNKVADISYLAPKVKAFFDHYVKGSAPTPPRDVTAITQSCPSTAKSEGPFTAPTWEALQTGAVVHNATGTQSILSAAGDLTVGKAFDPVAGGLACTTAPAADQLQGVATYRFPAADGNGYLMLGAPTVTADLKVVGTFPYIAARLLDVDPKTNTETLVARGTYRIDPAAPDGRQTFQLHANGWRFANGHVPKLELLPNDAPYSRPSNGVFTISVAKLSLRLPTHDGSGARKARLHRTGRSQQRIAARRLAGLHRALR